jgi:hypothetical protein
MVAYARTIASLRTLRLDASLMSAPPRAEDGLWVAVADVPTEGREMDATWDSVAGIAEKAAAAPPGPGGRRHMSRKAHMPGNPMTPAS